MSRAAPIAPALETLHDVEALLSIWPGNLPLLWLHSGRVHARWARWSILACPQATFRFDNGRSHIDGEVPRAVELTHDPLRDLDAILAATAQHAADDLSGTDSSPFRSGWIGFISYDLGRVIEPRAQHRAEASPGARTTDDRGNWPLIELSWCRFAAAYDHGQSVWHLDEAMLDRFRSVTPTVEDSTYALGGIGPELAPEAYTSMVARTIEYIAAGDIFQANIAQRFRGSFAGSTRALAIAAFRQAQPWYGAYLESPGSNRCLLSLSPELFLQTDPRTRRIVTRPIKGTRPASGDPRELRDSAKDQAELNMIVDLMRNDLGRICEYGSVRVPEPRIIESHPTVQHGVAEVVGRLRQDVSVSDILRATFPPGSVTGAPKIRAMQIIDELEGPECRRGPYCGAIGCFSDGGAMTLSVAIRTMLIEGRREGSRCDILRDGAASYSAGAGIVADSIPARELQETLDKAAVFRDLGCLTPYGADQPRPQPRPAASARAAAARCSGRSDRRRTSGGLG